MPLPATPPRVNPAVRQRASSSPHPTCKPRLQEAAIDLGATLVRQWTKPPDRKPQPMLDIPKSAEISHADGKILQSVSEGVGVITFNNPDKRNAMSLEMWEGLGHALTSLRDDPAVRVAILALDRVVDLGTVRIRK